MPRKVTFVVSVYELPSAALLPTAGIKRSVVGMFDTIDGAVGKLGELARELAGSEHPAAFPYFVEQIVVERP